MQNKERVEHELFEDDPAWDIKAVGHLKDLARSQLGTVGSGNHYVDLFVDESERVWCGVHFGSRGVGHKIATHFLRIAGGREGMHVDPVLLSMASQGRPRNTWPPWSLPAAMHMRAAIGSAPKWPPSWEPISWKKFIIIITLPGERITMARRCGWCARERLLHFPVRRGLSVEVWEMVSVIVQGVESEESKKGALFDGSRSGASHVETTSGRQVSLEERPTH